MAKKKSDNQSCERCASSKNASHICPLKLRIDEDGKTNTCHCCDKCVEGCKEQVDAYLKYNPNSLLPSRI